MTPRGVLVTFEGGEGSGKSTQLALLAARIRASGREVVTAREPGGTALGDALRPLTRKPAVARRIYSVLTGDGHWSGLTPTAELFLFEAARSQLASEVVEPSLDGGALVILDRYIDSTLAYQGYGRGIDLQTIRTLNSIATRGRYPDLTMLLDVDVGTGLARKLGEIGRDAIGNEHRKFHERVRAGYLELAASEPRRWAVLDATLAPDLLAERVWKAVEPLLSPTNPSRT